MKILDRRINTMSLVLQPDAPPLRIDASGAVRVGDSRVLLELVVRAFQDGATPDAIALRYPTLSLKDTYAAVAYYLRHPEEIDLYLREREQQASDVEQKVKATQPSVESVRARLLARKSS
jgi:uncharacterized protein (DUF433 family)